MAWVRSPENVHRPRLPMATATAIFHWCVGCRERIEAHHKGMGYETVNRMMQAIIAKTPVYRSLEKNRDMRREHQQFFQDDLRSQPSLPCWPRVAHLQDLAIIRVPVHDIIMDRCANYENSIIIYLGLDQVSGETLYEPAAGSAVIERVPLRTHQLHNLASQIRSPVFVLARRGVQRLGQLPSLLNRRIEFC